MVDLGVKWARVTVSSNFDDTSHLFGAGPLFVRAIPDSAQCALVLQSTSSPSSGWQGAGVSVQYNEAPGSLRWTGQYPVYKTPADFAGLWCGAVASHVTPDVCVGSSVFDPRQRGQQRYEDLFPGGDVQIAAYTKACYHAVKTIQPRRRPFMASRSTWKSGF